MQGFILKNTFERTKRCAINLLRRLTTYPGPSIFIRGQSFWMCLMILVKIQSTGIYCRPLENRMIYAINHSTQLRDKNRCWWECRKPGPTLLIWSGSRSGGFCKRRVCPGLPVQWRYPAPDGSPRPYASRLTAHPWWTELSGLEQV